MDFESGGFELQNELKKHREMDNFEEYIGSLILSFKNIKSTI
ncbi:hypothetical protein WN51_01559 [Melipona quadrifasciata]|uniref:Uncharacterized protein n=1 Tax=Melipona quadrifasciata TaxID=166423 RepID=A0A0M8ZZ04_9HYME|nr:hypothetical protein WN51_01559 [Melipona quadrifasciata]